MSKAVLERAYAAPSRQSRLGKLRSRINLILLQARQSWFSYLFVGPFFLMFTLFILVPTIAAMGLSLTYFNAVEPPRFIGLRNYMNLFTEDTILWKHAIPNTFTFAIIVGPFGYILSFVLAWLITQLPRRLRSIYTLAMYAPSMTAGIAMAVVWLIIFSGDQLGYLNSFLLKLGLINGPILWTMDPKYLMYVMVIVSLWASMGVGFLAMIAGILNVDTQLYEAGRIDGIKSRLQEIWYITIPAMKPQMLFGAVMAVVGTLKAGSISVELTGMNPTPEYSGHLMINHIDDYGFIRFEMGYASTLSVLLLMIVYATTRICSRLFSSKGE